MARVTALLCVGFLVQPLLSACAVAPAQIQPTHEVIVGARLNAASAERVFALRYNPTECGCSPFEILLGPPAPEPGADEARKSSPNTRAVWQRVEIAGVAETDPVISALRDHIARRALSSVRDRLRFIVEGRLESRLGTCGRGALYVSLVPTALVGTDENAGARLPVDAETPAVPPTE